jgi:predicted ATPase/DNA-binding CsgD family transcriptional regulator/tetratricopeptide (TPR) repeat protein
MNGYDSDEMGKPKSLVEPLSEREIEILKLIADNLSKREIAEKLVLAYSTVKWYTQQSYQKLGVHSRRQAVLRARELGLLAGRRVGSKPADSLPAQLTPFLGRQAELSQIDQLLHSPECRLLTLLGPGGIGKSRLAHRVAERLMEDKLSGFTDGVYFVSLAALSEARSLISTIAAQVKFSFYDKSESPETQLLNYLRPKKALLILDNFEQLLDQYSQSFLNALLRLCPRISLLVTSRTRLNLPGEHIFTVSGLEIPDPQVLVSSEAAFSPAISYSSIQLFAQSARRLLPDFELSLQNVLPVSQICRLLEGMPLGIELAATWVRILEPGEILNELEKSLHFLDTDGSGLGQELNLRPVFLASWERLAKNERLAIQKLSIFRGSFTHNTAQDVARVSLKELLSLVNQSWLQRSSSGRFQIHELLRQYAWEQLKEDPQLWQKTCEDFSAYFCELLSNCVQDWHNHKQLEVLDNIRLEIHNIETAWNWKVGRGEWQQINEAFISLCRYYEWTGDFQTGEFACRTIVGRLEKDTRVPGKISREVWTLLAYALVWQSIFTADREKALQLLDQSQALLKQIPDEEAEFLELQAFILSIQGERYWDVDREAARQNFLQSLDCYLSLEDDWGVAKTSQNLGQIAWLTGDYEAASKHLRYGLEIQQRLGDLREAALSMDTLAITAKHQGKLGEAEKMQKDALAINQKLGASADVIVLMSDLAHTLIDRGKFAEAISLASESLSRASDLGYFTYAVGIAVAQGAFTRVYLHQGEYSKVMEQARVQLAANKKAHHLQGMAVAHFLIGLAAIAEQTYPRAIRQFEKSHSILQEIQHLYTLPLAGLGLAYIKLQDVELAKRHLILCLEESLRIHATSPLMYSIPGLALLFRAQGRCDLARELYLLGLKQPAFAASRWYKDVTGEIAASIDLVPPGQPGLETREQEISPDFWNTMEKILLELEK